MVFYTYDENKMIAKSKWQKSSYNHDIDICPIPHPQLRFIDRRHNVSKLLESFLAMDVNKYDSHQHVIIITFNESYFVDVRSRFDCTCALAQSVLQKKI